MPNITLNVDDTVLTSVRRYAAEQHSSVNALIREYLQNLAAQEDRAKQAFVRIQQLSEKSTLELGEKAWTRDDLYDRKGTSRYLHRFSRSSS